MKTSHLQHKNQVQRQNQLTRKFANAILITSALFGVLIALGAILLVLKFFGILI